MFKNIVDISRNSVKTIEDIESKLTVSEIRQIKSPVENYKNSRTSGEASWNDLEYNFSEIDKIESIEAFMSLSFEKKLALFMKEGFQLVGTDPEIIEYVERRLNEVCYVGKTTLNLLLSDIAKNLIKYSNVFILVTRDEKLSGGHVRVTPDGKEIKPISALHVLPTSMIQVKTDKKGNVVAYRQYYTHNWKSNTDTNEVTEHKAKDVIHISVNKMEGHIVGTPRTIQAIEDIKALRRIETDIEILIHNGVIPFVQYKIGSDKAPAGYLPDGRDEVSVASAYLAQHPTEGIFVTPERHEIKMIGAEGRALRAETYMEYFKKRALSALHLSTVDIGEGETANRSTAAQMSRSLIDIVKSDQLSLEEQFFVSVIIPLLLESKPKGEAQFDWLSEENQVWLKFKEIDVDHQIKKDNATTQLWLNNLLTIDEARLRIGEAEYEEGELERCLFKLIGETSILLGSANDPGSPMAHAAAGHESVPVESKDINKAMAVTSQLERTKARAKGTQKKK